MTDYRTVPVEPTEEMLAAGERAAWDNDNFMPAIRAMTKAWSAMLAAAPALSASPAPAGDLVERDADLLHKTIKRLKGHVVAMSDGKKLVAKGQPGPSPNPIMACLADLPEIVRLLEAAEFDIEAAFEEHEARAMLAADLAALSASPAPAGDLVERVAGYPVTVDEHLAVAERVLTNIARPTHVDGAVVYSMSDDVPEDIAVALSYVTDARVLIAAMQPGSDND